MLVDSYLRNSIEIYHNSMVIKTYTATTIGLQANVVEIEVDTSPGLPSIVMVGLPDKAVQESKERIRSAIKQSGFDFPDGKITINLAPADLPKSGSSYDLPIALGVLGAIGLIKSFPEKSLFLGELALDGSLRPVSGVLSVVISATKMGFKEVFVPASNVEEARLCKDVLVYSIESLNQVINHLNKTNILSSIKPIDFEFKLNSEEENLKPNDFAYIRGQEVAKRALEIAASGGHNTMFIGPPGSGKTLLARSYATILPVMTEKEVIEVTQIYSIAGILQDKVVLDRPFRSPHHSCSHIALVGGGSRIKPGEISLAHRGVLFLDEFPEFDRQSIEALRQPLEDGFVSISRASGTLQFPSRFYLLAAANPTPGGFDPSDKDNLQKPQSRQAILSYQNRFSGPIMDRIDLQVEINRVEYDKLKNTSLAEKSSSIRKRVQDARNIQNERFFNLGITSNAEMNLALIQKFCALDSESQKLIEHAVEKYKLSARAYMRILKLSRTIADLAGEDSLKLEHIAESLQYRGRF
jgi:magnesium chelatase family protein